jgi:HK97 family phage prohead protease
MEKRCFEALMEVRQGESGAATLAGYAALFGEWSEDLGGFRERIAPGAFVQALTGDVRALWNHDPAFVLGRTTNGTLRLTEDLRGLRVEIDPPEGPLYAGFLENVRRGDVSQMSFGFSVIEDEKSFGENGQRLRLLKEVRLYEVSPVTFPAYPQTEVSLREWERGEHGGGNENGPPQAEETDAVEGTGIGEQGTVTVGMAAATVGACEEALESAATGDVPDEATVTQEVDDLSMANADAQASTAQEQTSRTRRLRLAAV